MSHELDPSLMQDFLTEAAELVERLDADLVRLESAATAEESAELLNSIFRALHTVKGAASFLNLTTVTTFAHAAEDALNRLRQGGITITTQIMDSLLKSTDVLRGMVESLSAGEEAQECPRPLIDSLHAIAALTGSAPADTPAADAAPAASTPADDGTTPLKLPEQKEALLEFMVSDLHDAVGQIAAAIDCARQKDKRGQAAVQLEELAESLGRTLDFFELPRMVELLRSFGRAAATLADAADGIVEETLVRLAAVSRLLHELGESLGDKRVKIWPLQTLTQRLGKLASGEPLEAPVAGKHAGSVDAVLALDGVLTEAHAADGATAEPEGTPTAAAASASAEDADGAGETDERRQGDRRNGADRRAAAAAPATEQTIRVEVGRLETLLNLVGQLVLNKNRFLGLTRKLRDQKLAHELMEEFGAAGNELDRLTGNLQVGIMRTRMQPMAKLFERYPRVIRDVARVTNKKINLQIVGKDTEVDKSVLELLADPLVHLLRNSADHGVELPQTRLANGKPETGTIRLSAQHQGSHVRIEIQDDGKGIDREVIGRKAVEKGLATAEEVAAMSEEQVLQFIFAPGFSTAEKVTDLSGRGVGMDVVRTNIAKINGTVNISTVKGQGTTIEVLIPLTVAIMPAMVVGVGRHLYAVPLSSITEIVRPEEAAVHSVAGAPVMKLRETVLPLIDMRQALNETMEQDGGRFAVVVAVGSQKAGLVVDHLVGQQEVVIKSLDDKYTSGGPFSGATIREDGDVSLILDVIRLLRDARAPLNAAA